MQILQLTAVDLDTGNNARITYKILPSHVSGEAKSAEIFGIFPNSGWLYLRNSLDRETKDHYTLSIIATDNGTPSESATTRVVIDVLDANDNDPIFTHDFYEFKIEENLQRGFIVGKVIAKDVDAGVNAAIRYSLIPSNSSFKINAVTGKFLFVFVVLLILKDERKKIRVYM